MSLIGDEGMHFIYYGCATLVECLLVTFDSLQVDCVIKLRIHATYLIDNFLEEYKTFLMCI